MSMLRLGFLAGAVASAVAGVTLTAQLQIGSARDPHIAGPDRMPALDEFVIVDDMLLYPEQLEAAGDTRYRAQAHPIDYRQRLGAWDSGVIPYQISADFSETERQRILAAFQRWASIAPVMFVPRTTQTGYLNITRDPALPNQASPCFSGVGQARRALVVRTNLGGTCPTSAHTVSHEFGHALGLWHEHQRSDRDQYLSIDFDNVAENARSNFNIITGIPLVGEYDFGSIMHYGQRAFAADTTRPTIIPHAPHQSWAARMGTLLDPSDLDHAAVAFLYNAQLRESTIRTPTEAVRSQFDRADLLLAMERLHAFYISPFGLQRTAGVVDQWTSRFSWHRAVDLRRVPAGTLWRVQRRRGLRHRDCGDHAQRRVAAEEPGAHSSHAVELRRVRQLQPRRVPRRADPARFVLSRS